MDNKKIILSLDPENEDNNIFRAGTIDEEMLSEAEREIVDRYVADIDVKNVEQVVNYGLPAQKNISDFSVSVLEKVKTLDLGDLGKTLKDLTNALDASLEPEKKGLVGLIQKAKRGMESIQASYRKAEDNVDRIEEDLKSHQSILMQDISMYQEMYELNTEYYKNLTLYIIAGKKALDKARNVELANLKKKAEDSGLQEDAQEYKDYLDQCNRFEKKISDLELTRMISIQIAPQVRLLQNNDREMLDKIQSSLSNTIPLWRNQLVLTLGIEHSRKAIEAQTNISDKTNMLLLKNAETLKMASIDAAKESERPIVDINTLAKNNQALITSINEVIRIHNQGTEKRKQMQKELIKIEEELKQAMVEIREV